MQTKKIQQKLKLFLNEPNLLKHYLERNHIPLARTDKIKTMFPPTAQLQRFRHLEHARMIAQRDIDLDNEVHKLVNKFQEKIKTNLAIDAKMQSKKQNTLNKLKMDYVQEQMSEHLQQLQKLIRDHEYYSDLILKEKDYVEKMIVMTEIKKALLAQNAILKRENDMLKKQEEEVDLSLNVRRKK